VPVREKKKCGYVARFPPDAGEKEEPPLEAKRVLAAGPSSGQLLLALGGGKEEKKHQAESAY